jgi:NAD(P)-dependent dehydrogenase (short-subunit alcohol dehydrogenase family)
VLLLQGPNSDSRIDMKRLFGKTALITGGNSGIGLATARLFREHGARLVITGRNPITLAQARTTLGGDVLAVSSDAGSLSDIERLMQQITEQYGQLDIVFINAASDRPTPFELVTEEQFDASAEVNFKGVFFTIQKALPLLSHNASIIVTTSISNQAAAPRFSVYAACKAALRSLVQSLGVELIGRGIRVNAISPGPIDTPGLNRWGLPREAMQAIREDFERKSPMKRFGRAEEIATAALFLASEDASYLVGTEIVVDGGFSLPL